jgi:malonyl-CoA O-methyltransferase
MAPLGCYSESDLLSPLVCLGPLVIASPLDPARVRRHFDRAAATFDAAAVLHREVGTRMLERLDLVRLAPTRLLDAGTGTGALAAALAARYPRADVVALDFSLRMLERRWPPRARLARLLRPAAPGLPVCAAMEQLPLASAGIDMVCSNLALQWSGAPEQVLREMHRVLRPGGLLMFTTLGPDTLQELRSAGAAVHAFADMHDVGDLLVRTGFADPVLDVEHIVLTYPDLRALLLELRRSGSSNAGTDAARGLRGRNWLPQLVQRYRPRGADARLPATFEIVHGHAWKPEHGPRVSADGRAVVQFHPRMR